MQRRENGSTEAQSSGAKRRTRDKNEEVPAKIQRFELDSNYPEYNLHLSSELFQYINKYMTTQVFEIIIV